MRKRLSVIAATTLGTAALLLGTAAPAAAARPSTTTPDGKRLYLSEFFGSYYSSLSPASAGDSVWTEARNSTTKVGLKTAASNVANLTSTPTGPFWGTWRACAQTVGGVTCTAWYTPG